MNKLAAMLVALMLVVPATAHGIEFKQFKAEITEKSLIPCEVQRGDFKEWQIPMLRAYIENAPVSSEVDKTIRIMYRGLRQEYGDNPTRSQLDGFYQLMLIVCRGMD